MLCKSSLIMKLILYLSLLLLSYEQQCVLGKNCPYNQGECITDYCICNKNYHTLLDSTLPPEQQIFCNYKKMSQFTPIVLEVFLPSIGHFVVRNYWLGLIKLSLLLTFIFSSYYLYNEIKLPELMETLLEKIGIEKFIGLTEGGKDEEGGDDKDKEEEKKEEEKKDEEKKETLRGRKDAEKNRSNYLVQKQVHEEESDNNENENDNKEPLINTGGEEDEEKKEENLPLKFAFEISGVFFSLMYFADLFLYKFNAYTDGYGVPFV